MQEFSSISASAYDAEALVPQLNEKSAEGWSVVSIVSAGTNVVAYLTREATGEPSAAADVAAETPAAAPAAAAVAATAATGSAAPEPTPAAAPVDEPAGWGAVAESTTSSPVDPGTTTAEPEPPAAPEPEPEPAPAAVPESTVPAGWYADPSGRFELRYWDGHQWTEHVSRDGQQFTDPPVA